MFEIWQAHLTFALLAFVVFPARGLSSGLQAVFLVMLLGISLIPVYGLSLAAYMRSFTDDVAITSLVGLAFAAVVRMGVTKQLARTSRYQLLIVMAMLAFFLYPAALGATFFDPYRLGYKPRSLIIVIGLITLVLLFMRNWLGVFMFGLSTFAFSLGLKPSPNYWDYLLDPFIALYCWLAVIGHSAKKALRCLSAQRKMKLPLRL